MRPLFILSLPRSGSTFLVDALDSHPRIRMTNEAAWLTVLQRAATLAGTPAREEFSEGSEFSGRGVVAEPFREAVHGAVGDIAPAFLDAVARRSGADPAAIDWFGDKIMDLDGLAFADRHLPEAGFLLLLRDPRDVLVSARRFARTRDVVWGAEDLEHLCDHAVAFLHGIHSRFAGRPIPVVRYEDLIAHPERAFGELLHTLGLDLADPVRTFLEGGAEERRRTHGTSGSPEASIGRWRSELDAASLEVLHRRLGPLLGALGYPVE